jgi:hypothetical protein
MIKIRQIFAISALAVSVISLTATFSPVKAQQQKTEAQKVQLMFVQTADNIKTDNQTIRLVNVNPQTLYFADRPVRLAGHITTPEYMKEWTASAGSDNFTNDPPNATLSVYEKGQPQNSLVVIEISNPVIDGKDIIYNYKVIEGTMPKTGGQNALFIDWIGAGGGVGAGYHGVGVGTRGVGVYGGYGGPGR